MKVIIVTGSVGTGKTKIAKKLAKKYKANYINVNKFIKKNKIAEYYDQKDKCWVVDIKKLNKHLISLIKNSNKNLVIDSHLSHNLPKKYVDLCIVTKCDLRTLKHRLEKRGYNKKKIRENLDSEIFDVCLIEALEKGHKVRVIDTSKSKEKIIDIY